MRSDSETESEVELEEFELVDTTLARGSGPSADRAAGGEGGIGAMAGMGKLTTGGDNTWLKKAEK